VEAPIDFPRTFHTEALVRTIVVELLDEMARAQAAKHAMSTTTNPAKAQPARSHGFDEVIDLSVEKLSAGVRRITEGYGADS
jgi:NADPH:quinone reductase-like Zn-dependent oxidoreductase